MTDLVSRAASGRLGSVRTIQAIGSAGAINMGASSVQLTGPASSTYAVTLAAPGAGDLGHLLTIEMLATTGSNAVTLGLTNVVGGTQTSSASFAAAGATLILVARSNKWVVLKELGVTLS